MLAVIMFFLNLQKYQVNFPATALKFFFILGYNLGNIQAKIGGIIL